MQGAYNPREISSAQFGSPGPPSPGSTRLLPSPELIFMTRKHELNVYAGSIDCSCTGALAIALEHSSWHRLQNGLACNIHTTAA